MCDLLLRVEVAAVEAVRVVAVPRPWPRPSRPSASPTRASSRLASAKNDTGVSKRRPLRDAPAVARPAAAPAPPKQPAMAPKPCAHCGVAIELPPQHALYWRCGACRKVNGRPAYARGFRAWCANCGVCAFYASRITHGCAVIVSPSRNHRENFN